MSDQTELDMGLPAASQKKGERISYTTSLLYQGKHKFYTLAMPSDILGTTCVVDTAEANPIDGFQRRLDKKRATDIANYIEAGLGTIPGSIVLSAQKDSELQYDSKKRTLSFKNIPRAFLIIDGQHRVYGFQLTKTRLRVPVVIYNGLTRAEEAALFMDVNTKQRPVPGELLLAIKRIAERERDWETLLRMVFDLFDKETDSSLVGNLSSIEKKKDKISRKTFNLALKPILSTFAESDPESIYQVLNPYLHAWLSGLRQHEADHNIANTTLFKAIILLFPTVAERVCNRYGEHYTTNNFYEILKPVFTSVGKKAFQNPGAGSVELSANFKKALVSGFSIGIKRSK